MKNNRGIIVLIVILSLICVIITGGFIYLLANSDKVNLNFKFSLGSGNLNLIDNYEIDYSNIDKILFDLHSTDIEIKESTNENILVEYYSNQDKNPKIEYDNNSIKVDENKYDVSCIGFCNIQRKVVLYVPNKYDKEYDIETKSGDINSDIDIIGENNNISTTSGDIKLNTIYNSNISTTSGDIKISKVSNIANINSTSGDIYIDYLNINNNSNMKTTSGDIKINHIDGNCYIDAKSTSGDIKVDQNNRKSDIILKISTISGDINVN